MKLFNAFVGLALVSQSEAAKTPFRRRLQKTFDLLPAWAEANLGDHQHSTVVRDDKMIGDKKQTKFDFKLKRLTNKIYDIYEAQVVEISQGCVDINTCDQYLDCTGVGDRMNTVRGRPDVQLSDLYLDFVKDKWGRSKGKVFSTACGFPSERISKLNTKVLDMVEAFRNWRTQCGRFTADGCPAHCSRIEKTSGAKCVKKN
jgi:hypothetical protein